MPSSDEVARRVDAYWRPYHAAWSKSSAHPRRTRFAVLLDGHSILSRVTRSFRGACQTSTWGLRTGRVARLRSKPSPPLLCRLGFTHVLNGRFKGGYITRHYGRPSRAGACAAARDVALRLCRRSRPRPLRAVRATRLVNFCAALSRNCCAGTVGAHAWRPIVRDA